MAPPILVLQGVRLTLGGKPLIDSADLSVERGDRLCLVGRNGSGKSTLLKIAAGEIEPDHGLRFFQPDATVRYLPQEPDLAGFATTFDYVMAGLGPHGDDYRAHYLLHELGLTGAETPATLSGGEARRAALARVLAPEPDILLLDEPTNHLDLPAIEWLESELQGLRSALVIISHDRRFLQNLSKVTVWLDRGATRRLERGFGEFESWRDAQLEQEERDAQKLEEKSSRKNIGCAMASPRGASAMSAAWPGSRRCGRAARRRRKSVGEVKLSVAEGKVSGRLVVEAEGVAKKFGDRDIVKNLSLRLLRGDRLALVGPNGAGKTTLINLLTGELPPDSGYGAAWDQVCKWRRSTSAAPRSTPMPTLADTLRAAVRMGRDQWGAQARHRLYEAFPVPAGTGAHAEPASFRAASGRCCRSPRPLQPSNFLVLDEPTNDLDLETLDLLQECSAIIPEPSCWSATTAIFSTASRAPSWSARARGAGSNMPAAIPTC